MGEETLESILEGADEEESQETEETTETEAATDVKEPEKTPEPPASSADSEVSALKAELARIRQQNRELKEKQEPEKKPDLWENTQEWESSLEKRFDSKLENTRIGMSEAFARKHYGDQDYEQKLDTFMSMVEKTPSLIADMRASSNPADFMYQAAKRQQMLDQVGDLDAYEKKVREKVEAELEEKIRKDYEQKLGKALPTSLSDTRAAGGLKTPVGDESLEDILGADAAHRR